jgi:hypothetical protein
MQTVIAVSELIDKSLFERASLKRGGLLLPTRTSGTQLLPHRDGGPRMCGPLGFDAEAPSTGSPVAILPGIGISRLHQFSRSR